MKKYLGFASILLTGGLTAFATTISPSGTPLGTLSGATFGGTGIPNTAVETTTYSQNQNQIVLGLTATQRYSNPALGNDGVGTFFATTGQNTGLDGLPHSLGPTWNFDYYIGLTDVSGTGYTFKLLYTDNTTGAAGSVNFGSANTSGVSQDSWNLSMGFLSGIGFDPNNAHDYGFELEALNVDGAVLAHTAINVDVNSVPDASSTALLLGLGFTGLAVLGLRQNRFAFAK